MGNCSGCGHWVRSVVTVYGDGSVVENRKEDPGGRGQCDILSDSNGAVIFTAPDFGCSAFVDSPSYSHVTTFRKDGAPWNHWYMARCPDCGGKGNPNAGAPPQEGEVSSRACHRCAGTGNVRHYDDGFVGDEQTRLHPKERPTAEKPKCAGCQREVEPLWVACPHCGHKLEAPAEAEEVPLSFQQN